jgi:hypothetical protein
MFFFNNKEYLNIKQIAMQDKNQTLNKLIEFRQKDKFNNAKWQERGLNPSDIEICNTLQNLFNNCADNLIEGINANYSSKQLKGIIIKWLSSVNSYHYDTEEKEFICDYFHELSEIVSVDIKHNLNGWLYGNLFNTLLRITSFFKGKEKIVETLTQQCTSCKAPLETFILKKDKNVPDHSWQIIQCNECCEFNILSLGPFIKECRFGNYASIEQLLKTEYTEEQAKIRLEQLKYFRKK